LPAFIDRSGSPSGVLVPREAADKRKGTADQEASYTTNHSCGNAELKHRRPRGCRVNLKADYEPDDHSNSAGYEYPRPRAIPRRRICPHLGYEAFHRANDYRRPGVCGLDVREEISVDRQADPLRNGLDAGVCWPPAETAPSANDGPRGWRR